MKRSLLALVFLAALPFAASAADDISYNYVEGGYAKTTADLADADGYTLNGSVAIAPNFHLFGGWSNQEFDRTNVDFDRWRFGVGYNRTLSPNLDLVTRVAYEKFDAGRDLDIDGYSTEVGVRGAANPNFEGYALAGWEDFERIDGEFYAKLGAQAKFNQTWGVAGEVKFVDGDQEWFVGPRVSW
jgi:Ax21 family sulfation-dependent quorum factor